MNRSAFKDDMQCLRDAARAMNLDIVSTKADGNCMFSALQEQLQNNVSAITLRQRILDFLATHPGIVENVDFASTEWKTFDFYMECMRKDGVHGDGIVLDVASVMFGKPIFILHGDGTSFTIKSPTIETNVKPLQLGYVALKGSNERNHYVGLRSFNKPECTTAHKTRKSAGSMSQNTLKNWLKVCPALSEVSQCEELSVSSEASLRSGEQCVSSESSHHGELTVSSETSQHGELTVSIETCQHGELTVSSETSQHGELTVSSETSQHGELSVSSETSQHGEQCVSSESSQREEQRVSSKSSQHGKLSVLNKTSQRRELSVSSKISQHGEQCMSSESSQHGEQCVSSESSQCEKQSVSSKTSEREEQCVSNEVSQRRQQTTKRKHNQSIVTVNASSSHNTQFNNEWTEKYMFATLGSEKPVCLICGFCPSVPKKYNLMRHYKTNHNTFDANYPITSSLRQNYISKRIKELQTQQAVFVKGNEGSRSLHAASYKIALLLAKNQKPFTDGEKIIKPALKIAAEIFGDKKIESKFNEIPLSNNTITRRVEELAENVSEQVKCHVRNCKFFSLAIDESNDITDTAQVAIFVRAISENFQIIEELLGLEPLLGTCRGVDIFNVLKACVERSELDWVKLDSICTDGAPAMTGKDVGCLALLQRFLNRQILKYHCFIHQEALCGKTLALKSVMDVVIKCVNKIRARALNRREFRQFLTDVDADYGELPLHCDVRWLSRGKVLDRFWSLRQCVHMFLREIDELASERESLVSEEWVNDLAFCVDITQHLNILNVRLQGRDRLFSDMCNEVASFQMKLRLFIGQLVQRKLENFIHLKERAGESVIELDTDKYAASVEDLLAAFQSRFTELASEQINIDLFTNPFTFPESNISSFPGGLQLEIIDLRCNSALRGQFLSLPPLPTVNDITAFWRLLPRDKFKELCQFAQRYLCRFGSTYCCEQSFSAMKLIKHRNRSRLTDLHLGSLMTLATTKLVPDIDKLSCAGRFHKSLHCDYSNAGATLEKLQHTRFRQLLTVTTVAGDKTLTPCPSVHINVSKSNNAV